MACKIKRNNKGSIIKVLDSTGKESKIFNKISKLPHVANLDMAVDIYNEVLKLDGDFKIKSDDIYYDSFLEALKNTESKTIDIESGGTIISSFPSTLDEATPQGVINSLLLDDFIEQERKILDGKSFFELKGANFQEKRVTEEVLKDYLITKLSSEEYSIKDTLLEIKEPKKQVSDEGSLHKVVSDTLLNYFSSDTVVSKNKIDEGNLKLNLLQVLSDMGVSVTTLKDYQERFKKKSNNIPPSAEALADITNRVIAFKEGLSTLDNLTEEVMHFIVETIPQSEIESMEEFIVSSSEYKDFSEQYKKVYKGNDFLVKKEILGKILKNITLNKLDNKEKSFISKLVDFIQQFFDNILVNSSNKEKFNHLNGIVEKFVIQQNTKFNEDDLAKSREIALLFSLSDQVSVTKENIEKTFKKATNFRQFNPYKRELKNTTFDQLKGKELELAVGRFVEMSTKLIETTDSAIKTSKKLGKSLSGQNLAILDSLDGEVRFNLASLATELDSPQPGMSSSERNKLSEKLRENVSKISDLKALNDKTTDDQIKSMVKEITRQMGAAESEFFKDQVEKVLRGEIEDTNRIFSFFGQLHHASNPILNLVGSKIWEMNMKANQGIKEDLSAYLNYIESENISAKDLESLVKDGYFQDTIDHKAFEEALLTEEMKAFSEISGQNFNSIKEYKEAKFKDELNSLSNEDYGKYKTLLDKKQQPYLEKIMNEQYYKELFDKYDRLNISGATQAFLKENSAQRGAIKSNATENYTDGNGNKQARVVLSPQDNDMLNSISKIRKSKKSIYSEVSLLKKGLKLTETKPETDSVLLPTGQYLSLNLTEDLTSTEIDEANISFDLHKLDNEYANEVKQGKPNSVTNKAKLNLISYISSLQDTHSESEVLDIIMSNLDIHLSSDFYDTLNGESFLKGNSLNKLNPNNLELVEEVKKLYAKRNSILSVYRNTSSPFEIDKMSVSDQETIRSLSTRISDSLKILTLPKIQETEDNSVGVKAPNKSYLQELNKRGIDQNTQEELDFLVNSQHTNVSKLNLLKDSYYKNRAGLPLSESEASLLNRYVGENILQTQLNYAKNNLQAYYTRFAPVGYKSIEERLSEGDDITDILKSLFDDKYLNIRIDPSFEEKDNPLKNPDYNDNYDGGFRQPKKGTFINKEFIKKFGINEKGEATKNKKLFEARRLYLEARKRGLEKMGEKGSNPYKVIQISATSTEKFRKLAQETNKKATAKELLKDAFAYRVDDVAYGQKGFEQSRVLPKYYIQDLEDSSDVSTDYTYALTAFVSRANEYNSKRNVISDIDALHHVLLTRRNSKNKNLKNTLSMFESFVDNSIYGKQETLSYQIKVPGTDYTFDLAKVSRILTKYISLKNLGYNVTVPLTGYLSGVASKKVEEWIGEKLNKDSSKLATSEYKKLMRDGYSQALNINDNSKLFLIGQAFGLYDISEKARNAKYNKFQRTFSKSAMALHTMANYPIVPKIALTVLFDNRVADGVIYNRQQFFQEEQRKGTPREQTEAKWKNLEERAIYNYMNFDKDGFTWSPSIKEFISDNSYLEDRKLFMMRFIRNQVSNIDATIPTEMRLTAQRNALGSMILLHKGFLSIFLQNRFKNRNLNIDSGLLEEGSYRTLGRLTADFFNTKGDMGQRIDALKKSLQPPDKNASNQEWLEYELNVRNMKRIGKEIGAMAILASLGSLVFAAASDPDNEDIYALQMTSYLTSRLLNESATAFTPSLLVDLNGVIESPLGVYDSGKEILKISKLFDGDEITRGKYKGLNQREKWITKNVLGVKGLYDIWGADNVRQSEDTYRLYNEENIDRGTLGLNSLYKSFYKN